MAREVISELEKGEKNNALIDESVELKSSETYVSAEWLWAQGYAKIWERLDGHLMLGNHVLRIGECIRVHYYSEDKGHYEEEGEVFIMDSNRPSFIIWNSQSASLCKPGEWAKSNCRY